MSQTYGFRLTCDYVAFISLAVAILYFLIAEGRASISETLKNRKRQKKYLKTEIAGHSMKMTLLSDEEKKQQTQ